MWLFCDTVLFFWVMHPGRTVALILTVNGPNDVFPPMDGPFGGQGDGWRHMGNICPKNSPQRAWIGSFKPKRQNLYIAISLELLIRRTSGLRTEFRPRKALCEWSAITTKQIQHGWWPTSWKSVCGRFPDSHFPGQTFPGQDDSRTDVSRTMRFSVTILQSLEESASTVWLSASNAA